MLIILLLFGFTKNFFYLADVFLSLSVLLCLLTPSLLYDPTHVPSTNVLLSIASYLCLFPLWSLSV